jgi:glycosyltransferase involved in cell wall biosynthesis
VYNSDEPNYTVDVGFRLGTSSFVWSAFPQMRIAFVITELFVGGAERCLVNVATGLDRARFEPVVYSLAPSPPEGPQRQLVEQLEHADVPVHFFGASSIWHYSTAFSQLAEAIRRQQADLVQSFLFHANVIAARAVRRAQGPRFVAGIRVADPRRWRMWVERRELQHADAIVCVSDSVASYARSRVGLPDDQLRVIANGVDTQFYSAATPTDLRASGIAPDQRVLLYVGRLDVQKGLDWLLRVTPRLLKRCPEHHLVLAGSGPKERALRNLAEQTSSADRIHFVGWRNDIPQLLARSDLLLLPSRWEGMPNVVLEAMAAGKPVVATRSDGVEQLLGELSSTQTVAFANDDDLLERVTELLSDLQVSERVAHANLRRAEEHFSLPAAVRRYAQLYESLDLR